MTLTAADLGVPRPRLDEIRCRIVDRKTAADQLVERFEAELNKAVIARGIVGAELASHDRAVEAMQLPEAAAPEPRRRDIQGSVIAVLRSGGGATLDQIAGALLEIPRSRISRTLDALAKADRARRELQASGDPSTAIWRLTPAAPGTEESGAL